MAQVIGPGVQGSISDIGSLGNLVKTYYDRMLLETLDPD